MSLVLSQARGRQPNYRGGLFGDIWGGIKSVAKAVVPGARTAIGAAELGWRALKGSPTTVPQPVAPYRPALPPMRPPSIGRPPSLPMPPQVSNLPTPGSCGSPPVVPKGFNQVVENTTPEGACPKGYHPNKAGYFEVMETPGNPQGLVVYHHPGCKCVRNRRRNPMNPKALSKAISRIDSAKKLKDTLSRVTIRKKCSC